jgi:hypothetical protein
VLFVMAEYKSVVRVIVTGAWRLTSPLTRRFILKFYQPLDIFTTFKVTQQAQKSSLTMTRVRRNM